MNVLAIVLGVVATLAGLAMLAAAIRNRGDGENPRATAMLIAGMMITAFGLLIAGFTIGFATSDPLEATAGPTS